MYDTLLSFPQEIRCIWERKYGIVTVLYLLIRYGTICDMLIRVFDGLYVPTNIPVSGSNSILALVSHRLPEVTISRITGPFLYIDYDDRHQLQNYSDSWMCRGCSL